MKRVIAIALALACAACGDSPEPASTSPERAGAVAPQSGAANEAPTIEVAVLSPDPAGAEDPINLELHTFDRERDRLTTVVEWYKNGVLVQDLREASAPSGTFSQGDRVYATITISDASHEVTRQTPSITIVNSPPRVRSVQITPAPATASDLLEARVEATDADGDSIELSYRWYKNGSEIPGATTSRLPPGSVRRGDKVGVEAAASDGTDTTHWVGAPIMPLANAKPEITTQPGYEMGPTGVYSYDIRAKDPDGDQPLRYELVSGPRGMTVDEASGAVSWTVPQDASGNSPIEIAVSDPYGGRVTQRWVLSVDWNQAPAAPSEASEAKPKPAPAATPAPTPAADESGLESEAVDEDETPAKPAVAKPAPAPPKAKSADDDDDDSEQDEAEETDEEEF